MSTVLSKAEIGCFGITVEEVVNDVVWTDSVCMLRIFLLKRVVLFLRRC